MIEIRKPIEVDVAIKKVASYFKRGETEQISFHDCDNRRLTEPIVATNHIPSFDKSPYDGFAFRSIDTRHATKNKPVSFKVVDHIGAGENPLKTLQEGEVARIMTGAEIPEGADCVAMFEVCDSYKDGDQDMISITKSIKQGDNIIKEGSEVKKGTTLVKTGTLIDPGVKASLATFGYDKVWVAKEPIVGVIATGTELLDVHEELERGKIRNSNAYMIGSQIIRAGGKYKYLGKLSDDFDPSYKKIKESLAEVDFLITTGGVSVGDYDLMPDIYKKLNANILFNKVAMRPGSVTTVAEIDGKILFGLSGNPSACYVGFELFARPVIQYFLYNNKPYTQRIKAELAEDFLKKNPFSRFVRTYITYKNKTVFVNLAGMDKSNVVTSLAHTTSLMFLPGGTEGFTAGSEVEVLLVDDHVGQESF